MRLLYTARIKKKKSKDVTILLPIHLLAILKLAINAKTSKWH